MSLLNCKHSVLYTMWCIFINFCFNILVGLSTSISYTVLSRSEILIFEVTLTVSVWNSTIFGRYCLGVDFNMSHPFSTFIKGFLDLVLFLPVKVVKISCIMSVRVRLVCLLCFFYFLVNLVICLSVTQR